MRAITGVSLFNGAGGLFMMLNELNIPIKQLYVCEIDKFANQAADLLYDKNIHLGCITNLRRATCWKLSTLVKAFNSKYLSDKTKESLAASMDLRGKFVDVLGAGFPCQAWSLAGKQKGDNDPRGALVHDMLKLWFYMASINPGIKFFFENVAMKKEFMTYINNLFKCEPVKINSALLTAQNRERNYWANWEISQPEDLGILFEDVLDENHNEKLRPCIPRNIEFKKKTLCHHVANAADINGNESIKRIYGGTGKSPTLTTMGGGHREPKILIGRIVGRKINKETGKRDDYNKNIKTKQYLESRKCGKSGCITTVEKDNVVIADYENYEWYRKATITEIMKLQGWPQWVIDTLIASGISATQLKKICGNGWTHPVIVHDFQCLLDTGWPDEA